MKRLLLACLALLLGACASLPAPTGSRTALRDFALEGRFALRVDRPGEAPGSASGRLRWQHQGDADRLFIASPLGSGIASLELTTTARLVLASGEVREAADGEALLRESTGLVLPVSRLSPWLLGRARAGGRLALDEHGRPLLLREDGWRVDYGYADDTPDALPVRLTVSHDGVLELRLRIEEWSEQP